MGKSWAIQRPGRCIGCGFLARHIVPDPQAGPPPPSQTYYEIEPPDRLSGQSDWWETNDLGLHRTEWCCFRRAAPLPEEIAAARESSADPNGATVQVIERERNCPKSINYEPGLPPRAHLFGLAMQEQEQRQYAFQESLEENRRKFDLWLSEKAEEAQKRAEHAQKRDRRIDLLIGVAAIALAATQLLTAGPDSIIGRSPVGRWALGESVVATPTIVVTPTHTTQPAPTQ